MPWDARDTMSLRSEFVLFALQDGANIRSLCRHFGISPATGYKWLARWSGWFRFRKNMIRVFVRMQAEKCGIVLDFDRQYSAHTASTRTAVVNPLSTAERSVARLRRHDEKEAEENE